MEMAIILIVSLGLRCSESVALTWSDIDWEKNTITVKHSCDRHGNLKTPKTKAGIRTLPMSNGLRKALLQYRKSQADNLAKFNIGMLTTDCETGFKVPLPEVAVITDIHGNRIHPGGLAHYWNKHRADYGHETISLHNFRHTFISLAAENGIHPAVVQALAGHSSSRITMDIYTHINSEAKRNAMAVMDSVFST